MPIFGRIKELFCFRSTDKFHFRITLGAEAPRVRFFFDEGAMYQHASSFGDKRRICWDSPKPLKVSGILLTSDVVSQRRFLQV